MDQLTKDFLTYDYQEAKDLAKSFLTLIAAILVFSITFSEKIIGFQTAARRKKIFLIMSWVLFLIAVIACGVALCVFYSSIFDAVSCGLSPCDIYGLDYWGMFYIGTNIMTAAGVAFGLGLISLIVSALLSVSISPLGRPSTKGSSTDVLVERLILDSGSDTKSDTALREPSTGL